MQNLLFHITPKRNLESIKKNGLIPQEPKDFEDVEGVYFFKDRISAEDAMMNWFVDRECFEEDEDFVLLSVDPSFISSLDEENAVEYECIVTHTVPWEAVVAVEDF